MLIRLLRTASSAERERIAVLLRADREHRKSADVAWLWRTMKNYDCVEYARDIAHGLAGAARHEYSLLFGPLPDTRDKRFVEGLVTWVFERRA
jgi:geranylgeranyl diphosphate synthase type II